MDTATRHLIENINKAFDADPNTMFGRRIVTQLVAEILRLDALLEGALLPGEYVIEEIEDVEGDLSAIHLVPVTGPTDKPKAYVGEVKE